MNSALASTLRWLDDRKTRGIHYDLHTGSVRATFDASLCRPDGAAAFIAGLDSLMDTGQTIKKDRTAVVARVRWNGLDLAVKRYNRLGFLHSLRHTMKGSRARRVWLHGHLLNRIGVLTPVPLAFIEMTNGPLLAQSYIITPYVDAPNLSHIVKGEGNPGEETAGVVRSIADVMALMASHNISHGDMKHTNILLTPSGPVLTDLDSMTIHTCPLRCRRQRRLDAARFMRDIDSSGLSPEMRRLCSSFICGAMPAGIDPADSYESTEHLGWKFLIRQGFKRDDAFAIVGGGGICLDNARFKQGSSSDTARVFLSQADCCGRKLTVYIKDSFHRSVIDSIKHVFRAGRARRAFFANLMLRNNGVDSPEPLTLIEKCVGPFCSESVIVTEGVEGAILPSVFLKNMVPSHGIAGVRAKRLVLRRLGVMVGRMHSHGIFHGDLRHDNILLQRSGDDWNLSLIDNERTRQFWRIPHRLRLKNLVQLNMTGHGITRTDRMRFFRAYSIAAGLPKDMQQDLIAKIVPLTIHRLKVRQEHHAND